MKLIDEWKDCWKFLSVQANVIGAGMISTYGMMYDHLKDSIPPRYMAAITAAVFVAGIIGRIVSQQPPTKE